MNVVVPVTACACLAAVAMYAVDPEPPISDAAREQARVPVGHPAASPDLERLAEQVRDVYEHAEAISLHVTVEQQGATLEYHYDGTPTAFRTVAFHDGKLYGAFSFDAGRVQELVPDHPARLVLHYDSEHDDQIPHLVYPRPLDCQYGAAFGFEVGPKAGLDLRTQRIGGGEYLGTETVNDRTCYKVTSARVLLNSKDQPTTIRHTYWIDASSRTIARWQTHQGDVIRTRTYDKVVLNSAPPSDWDILSYVDSLPTPSAGAHATR